MRSCSGIILSDFSDQMPSIMMLPSLFSRSPTALQKTYKIRTGIEYGSFVENVVCDHLTAPSNSHEAFLTYHLALGTCQKQEDLTPNLLHQLQRTHDTFINQETVSYDPKCIVQPSTCQKTRLIHLEQYNQSKMSKLLFILLLYLIAATQCRTRKGKGAGKVGRTMGNGLATLINDIRDSEPERMPKGYKRKVDKPVQEEDTIYGKIKYVVVNLIYLGVVVGLFWVAEKGLKVYLGVKEPVEDDIRSRREGNRSKQLRQKRNSRRW